MTLNFQQKQTKKFATEEDQGLTNDLSVTTDIDFYK
jgi:hypothetical protein